MRKRVAPRVIVPIVLAIALMAVLVGDSAGSRFEMDTDLRDSFASFIGEDTDDGSGWPVAGAGDVNGDGYDDILISARGDDDGGYRAGQTYLILGKASRWSMDIDLSNADASFWGEEADDRSGWSVAGAGDVNGDGYDDILIGAPYNDEGGNNNGQTYLILGMASGWQMDTDLSNADASFIGEDEVDRSGISVAGAGDVNGDGYDDILIGAPRNDEGGSSAGQTYIILGKKSGWQMDTNLSNANASFWGEDASDMSGSSVAGAGNVNSDGYDDILIGAPSDEDGGGHGAGQTYLILGKKSGWSMDTDLSNADASFWGEDADDASGWSLAGAGDVNGDGYDDILIGAYRDEDGGARAGQTYFILGKRSGWSMGTDLSNADASFIGEDERDESGSVAGAGDVNGDGYDDILIGAYHNGGTNYNGGQTYLIFGKALGWAMDTDLSNADASFLGERWRDSSGMSVAGVGDVNGDGYDDILIGAPENDDGGSGAGQTYLVSYDDGESPRIEVDMTPAYATTGDLFTFNVSVSDNYGLYDISIEHWYGDSQFRYNSSADRSSGNETNCTWLLQITIPMSSTETLHYIVHVMDLVDRLTSSIQKDVAVSDNDLPILGTDHTANTATTGEILTFSLEARDNIGIEEVWVEYHYGEGALENISLSVLEGDVWEATIVIADTLGLLQYSKNAVDAVGNLNSGSIGLVDVIDNDGPEIVNNGTPHTSTTGDPFTFSVTVSDNIGIRSVDVWYSFGKAEPTSYAMEVVESHENGNVLYSLTIDMPSDSLLPLSYNLEVWDLYGNVQTGIEREVEVVDNDRPVIEYWGTITEALKGLPVTLTIDAMDNIGVDGAFIVLRYGGLATTNLSMEPSASHTVELSIPRDVSSDLHYHFSVYDAADNWYSTVEYTIQLKNAAPAVEDLPKWTITEEAEGELDLTSYISDENDYLSSLTVSCGDGTVTVNGLVLMALFNEAVPDWTIDLTVSDGEDDTDVQVTIHIVNVNDVPLVVSISPEDGAKYKEGKMVTFTVEVTDEDEDELTVTWTSDGVIIGTGATLEYKKLKQGTRTIKVTVSDGETSVEDEFSITIKKEEESPGFGALVSIIVILTVLALTRARLVYRGT